MQVAHTGPGAACIISACSSRNARRWCRWPHRRGHAPSCHLVPSLEHPPTRALTQRKMKGKNKPSRRHRKKQTNVIEERKPRIKAGAKELVRPNLGWPSTLRRATMPCSALFRIPWRLLIRLLALLSGTRTATASAIPDPHPLRLAPPAPCRRRRRRRPRLLGRLLPPRSPVHCSGLSGSNPAPPDPFILPDFEIAGGSEVAAVEGCLQQCYCVDGFGSPTANRLHRLSRYTQCLGSAIQQPAAPFPPTSTELLPPPALGRSHDSAEGVGGSHPPIRATGGLYAHQSAFLRKEQPAEGWSMRE